MRFLTFNQLRDRGVPFCRVHLDRLVKADKFPKPIHLSERRIAWIEAEIDAWAEQRAAQRETKAAA